jgi:type III restriction enzyme
VKNSSAGVAVPQFENERQKNTLNRLNPNFEKKEFQKLWKKINHKAVYTVEFDSKELIEKSITILNENLRVAKLQFRITTGTQKENMNTHDLGSGQSFGNKITETQDWKESVESRVRYDLIGKIAENVNLTRRTVAEILCRLESIVLKQFQQNPEQFISEACRLIQEQKATVIIEHLSYDTLEEKYNTDIFTSPQLKTNFAQASARLKRHIYDYVVSDSKVEKEFAEALDVSEEVVVYAKLPRGFSIPTPVGNYNPDWAISFKEGVVKHIYFVAETKGSMSSMQLKQIENAKIKCARKFFELLAQKNSKHPVRYDVVTTYDKLMDVVCRD